MHYHGRVRRPILVRLGIRLAVPLFLLGASPVVLSQPPDLGPELRPAEWRPSPGGEIADTADGTAGPAAEFRLQPAGAGEAASAEHRGGAEPPETLQQAWAIALAVDHRLEARRWEVSATEQSLRAARAQRWPVVAVETSYVLRSDEPAFRFGTPGVPLPTDTFPYAQDENFGFRTKIDLPLYTGGRIGHGIAAASASVVSAELQVEDSKNDLKLRVAGEYVGVLRAQREMEVAESNVRSLEAHARDVELLFRHDQVPRNDLLAAQVALSNARQRAIQAATRLDISRAAYSRRLGRPLTSAVRIAELPLEHVEGDVEGLTARALGKRPELARLAAQAGGLRDQAISLRAKNLPQFGLWGQYAFEENRFTDPEGIASMGVGLTCDVFDGGRNRYQAAALMQRAEGLMRLRADLESTIALEVRRAWLDIRETRLRLEVTSEATQRAEENLRVARKRYVAGMGISTEVLDAEALRTETYRNHDNASHDAVLAVLRLRHATGDLAE